MNCTDYNVFGKKRFILALRATDPLYGARQTESIAFNCGHIRYRGCPIVLCSVGNIKHLICRAHYAIQPNHNDLVLWP